ncbi:hypothetical protein AHAS_Ahas01G0157000 [Arachis hypogaea]
MGPMEVRIVFELVNKNRVVVDCRRKATLEKGDHRAFFKRDQGKNFAPRGHNFKRSGYIPQFYHG